ncbi:conserved protein, unknown function [Hepatocystis sp. ex Piliocolobus tephrosceles]|nr:conserved protein, unknown function [Hepatocystis sp. ex Piliocolobus tephrosceles]
MSFKLKGTLYKNKITQEGENARYNNTIIFQKYIFKNKAELNKNKELFELK